MDEPTITFSNPSYREWLLQKAGEAVTLDERERLLALADGQPVAPKEPTCDGRTTNPTARDRTYVSGIKGALLDAAKMSNVPPSVADLMLDAHDRLVQIEALSRALIRQIELGDFTDAHGHKLTSNMHFIKAKEAVGE